MDTTEHWKRKTPVFLLENMSFLERITKGSWGIESHWKDCVRLLGTLTTGTESYSCGQWSAQEINVFNKTCLETNSFWTNQ